MTNLFQVSVIIPVYNAEAYLKKAVESAVHLKEVIEIILVEDKSPDNALEVCKELEKQFDKVKLFQHPNGENRGAGASRNLGIEKSSYNFIAFLDADDWFLPNRFEAEKKLLINDRVDGVYGATGYFFEDQSVMGTGLTTISPAVSPENLLFHLLFKRGHFCLDALTIKKSKLLEIGKFDTSLRLHQDTHMLYKLVFHSKIFPGITEESIAIRRVHSQNRVSTSTLKSKAKFRKKVFETFRKYNGVDPIIMNKIKKEYFRLKYFRKFYEIKNWLKSKQSK